MRLSESVTTALEVLEAAGFEAYPVGGCVRDHLRGVTPSDYDIATSAMPEEVLSAFSDHSVHETGRKHGTVTVVINGSPLEITTFRVDAGYSDGRHPDAVRFTRTLSEDLARRDFTVNAMAYHPMRGVVDLFGGRADLENRLIRCVGKPEVRFSEDALRILRGLRFAATLGFRIEAETAAAMRKLKNSLRLLSTERVTEEIVRLSCGTSAATVTDAFSDVLEVVLPGFCPNTTRLSALPPTPALRLAALLGNRAAVGALRLSNELKRKVTLLLTAEYSAPNTRYDALRALRAFGEDVFLLLTYHGLDPALVEEAQKSGVWRPDQLAISGHDLMAHGINGRAIGETLEALLDSVMRGETENEPHALLAQINR